MDNVVAMRPHFHASAEPVGPPAVDPGVHEADRRIALALYRAQSPSNQLASAPSLSPAAPKTLAEIVTLVGLEGWSRAFRALKVQGLIEEQTLGHVVARWSNPLRRSASISPQPRAALRGQRWPVPSRTG